jgi:phosphopentomutase
MEAYEKAIGMETLGNYAASGTEIIETLGPEHEKTGKPIIYTSADSVFQIAANTAVIPLEKLYHICEVARKMLVGDVQVGRVIARPYIIENGKRVRTADRKDYAVSPSGRTVLDSVKDSGKIVYTIGKIKDIFNGQGVDISVHTESNMDGVDKTLEAMYAEFGGFVFTNLVDFDAKYGHRRDPVGYGKAIEDFDRRLPEIFNAMRQDDILILCADHGNDPIHSGWDHTREHVPVVLYGKNLKPGVNLGTRKSFADIGATIAEYLSVPKSQIGESFLNQIQKEK